VFKRLKRLALQCQNNCSFEANYQISAHGNRRAPIPTKRALRPADAPKAPQTHPVCVFIRHTHLLELLGALKVLRGRGEILGGWI